MKRAGTARVGRLDAGDLVALGVAVIVHATLLVAPLVMPARERLVARSSHRFSDAIEIVLLPAEAAPAAIAAPQTEEPAAAPSRSMHAEAAKLAARVDRDDSRIARIDPAAPRAVEAPPHQVTEPPPSAPAPRSLDEYGGSAPVGPANAPLPGLVGASPVWTLPGALPLPSAPTPAPTVAARAPEVPSDIATRVLNGTQSTHDHEVGIEIPAAGIVANVISDAVRTAALPDDSRATFEVKLGSTGAVESVRLVSSNIGDAGVWGRVVGHASASLAARSLTAPGEGGATVRVKIQSTRRYPSGAKKPVEVEPVCANDIIEQIEEFVQDPSSAQARTAVGPSPAGGRSGMGMGSGLPPVDGSKRRFCIPIGVGVRADLSDINAHAQTVVKSSVEVVRAGERSFPTAPTLPLDDRAPWLPADPNKAARPAPPPRKKKKKPS